MLSYHISALLSILSSHFRQFKQKEPIQLYKLFSTYFVWFTAVLPNWDQDRVHDSDIKKLIQWYNILVKNGYGNFKEVLAPTEGDNVDDRAE